MHRRDAMGAQFYMYPRRGTMPGYAYSDSLRMAGWLGGLVILLRTVWPRWYRAVQLL